MKKDQTFTFVLRDVLLLVCTTTSGAFTRTLSECRCTLFFFHGNTKQKDGHVSLHLHCDIKWSTMHIEHTVLPHHIQDSIPPYFEQDSSIYCIVQANLRHNRRPEKIVCDFFPAIVWRSPPKRIGFPPKSHGLISHTLQMKAEKSMEGFTQRLSAGCNIV